MTDAEACALAPVTDPGRIALLAAIRRDWRPPPATLPWTPAMQHVLFDVALQIEAEARGYLPTNQGDLPI